MFNMVAHSLRCMRLFFQFASANCRKLSVQRRRVCVEVMFTLHLSNMLTLLQLIGQYSKYSIKSTWHHFSMREPRCSPFTPNHTFPVPITEIRDRIRNTGRMLDLSPMQRKRAWQTTSEEIPVIMCLMSFENPQPIELTFLVLHTTKILNSKAELSKSNRLDVNL